jgi:dolichol kinase
MNVVIHRSEDLITRTQASVVGKRVGRYKWSPTTPKTLEGSAGFTVSVVAFAWALRICGLVEEFSASLQKMFDGRTADHFLRQVVRYGAIIGLGSVLEAMSGQNDNIILPVYVWSMLAMGLIE